MKVREHGTRACYVWGVTGHDRNQACHCSDCTRANREYAKVQEKRSRLRPRATGPFAAPFVDPIPVRTHLLELGELGIGYKRVAALAGVSQSACFNALSHRKDKMRREVAEAILAVPLTAPPAAGQIVDATEVWRQVGFILAHGWTKGRLSRAIGQNGRALQLSTEHVTAKNAASVQEVYNKLLLLDAAKVMKALSEIFPPPAVPRPRTSNVFDAIRNLLEDPAQSWRVKGACRGPDIDPAIFFPGQGDDCRPAKAICKFCMVRTDCLEYALANNEKSGIWGGVTERGRRRLRTQRRKAAAEKAA